MMHNIGSIRINIMSVLQQLFGFILLSILSLSFPATADGGRASAVGDPGMRRDGLRVGIEAWNQCNEVNEEAPNMGSPRMADCFDINNFTNPIGVVHRVKEEDNKLGIVNASYETMNVDQYAAWKEIYLGRKCEVQDKPNPWQFWMIMVKSGNMDTIASKCPKNGKKALPFPPESGFPCFGPGCMNMPLMYHNYTRVQENNGRNILKGGFYGTWDLNSDVRIALADNNTSYYQVTWEKEVGNGSWKFHHVLKTSSKYPWLMLYLRSDATTGYSGGYHYQTRGMLKMIPKSPDFTVKFTLEIKKGGGPKSQFYLMDIGSCWKNNGDPCNGDVTTDVTRYSEMIINPSIDSWCNPTSLWSCPPYHTLTNGTQIHRSDQKNFPYEAYHIYCSPGNAQYPEEPYNFCDPYSNPQPQEILQILPHPVWGEYGYPTKKGEGWIGDARTWELVVGRLSQNLYFYQVLYYEYDPISTYEVQDVLTKRLQDPGTPPAERHWSSVDLGTEIYMSENQIAEWTVKDFDITVPEGKR